MVVSLAATPPDHTGRPESDRPKGVKNAIQPDLQVSKRMACVVWVGLGEVCVGEGKRGFGVGYCKLEGILVSDVSTQKCLSPSPILL